MRMRKSKKPIEDAAPLPVVRSEAKNWADMGNKLVGQNTRNMVVQEVPSGAVFNQSGSRFYQTKTPMSRESVASNRHGGGKGAGTRKMAKAGITKPIRDAIGSAANSFGSKFQAQVWDEASPRMAERNAKQPMVMEQRAADNMFGDIKTRPTSAKNVGSKGSAARKMAKSKAKVDAQRWVDAADQMSSANAKKPMVVEQMPSGAIMGRGTSAKNVGSKGSAARKMSKSQGAYINGKPASADLTKAMRPRKKG